MQQQFAERIFKWKEQLQQYDFDMEPIPKWENIVAGTLNRRDEEDTERRKKKLMTN